MASTESTSIINQRLDRHAPATAAAPTTKQPLALRIVREEHERLAAVVHGMRHLARAMEEQGLRPDLKVLRAMLLYISEYPERLHHPKEDRFLFAPLRDHTHQHDAMLVELEVQHAQGEAMGTSALKEEGAMSVEECARLIIVGMNARRREVVMTAKGKLGRYLKLLAPGVVEKIALAALKDDVKPR